MHKEYAGTDLAEIPQEIDTAINALVDAAFRRGAWIPSTLVSLAEVSEIEHAARAKLYAAIARYGVDQSNAGYLAGDTAAERARGAVSDSVKV